MTAISTGVPAVLAPEDCDHDMVDQVGGKAAGLGSLVRAGQRVPRCFVVTAAAYDEYIASSPRQMSVTTRELVVSSYRELCEPTGAPIAVAVRSSATIEDSSAASCAGQFLTHLGSTGADEVAAQVVNCWESAFAPHVDAYRAQLDAETAADGGVAVVVQELVHAQVAGVMFTQHPRTADRSLLVVEASYGLGEAVVGGEVTPDLYEINKVTRAVHTRTLGSKAVEHLLDDVAHQVLVCPVEPERQNRWALADEQLAELAAMAAELERSLGRGLDIEWAFGTTTSRPDEPALYALQVRPITVTRERSAAPAGAGPVDLIIGQLSQPRSNEVDG